jgi:D-arabinose 1-dehydrogenase-like Zn-dependent alcohol dehydrogenase
MTGGGYKIIGTALSPMHSVRAMLDFAAKNKIYPLIEKFPMSQAGLTDAFNKLIDGKMRYRGVLAW